MIMSVQKAEVKVNNEHLWLVPTEKVNNNNNNTLFHQIYNNSTDDDRGAGCPK